MEKFNRRNRRRFLITTGSLIAGSTIGASATTASDSDTLPNSVKQQLRERYGDEADVLIKVLIQTINEAESEGLSPEAGYNRAADRIVARSDTPKATTDIREVRELRTEQEHDTTEATVQTNETHASLTSVSTTDVRYVYVGDGEKGGSSSLSGAADRAYDPRENTMRANARIALSGGATGYARLFRPAYEIRSHLAGDVQISLPYYRLGTVQGGNAKISLFIRDSSGTIIKKTVEQPNGVDGSTTGTAQFVLNEGESYDIGVEIYTNVSGINAYSYADFYNNSTAGQRQVELNGPFEVTPIN